MFLIRHTLFFGLILIELGYKWHYFMSNYCKVSVQNKYVKIKYEKGPEWPPRVGR